MLIWTNLEANQFAYEVLHFLSSIYHILKQISCTFSSKDKILEKASMCIFAHAHVYCCVLSVPMFFFVRCIVSLLYPSLCPYYIDCALITSMGYMVGIGEQPWNVILIYELSETWRICFVPISIYYGCKFLN